jgi:hypothetical protein
VALDKGPKVRRQCNITGTRDPASTKRRRESNVRPFQGRKRTPKDVFKLDQDLIVKGGDGRGDHGWWTRPQGKGEARET